MKRVFDDLQKVIYYRYRIWGYERWYVFLTMEHESWYVATLGWDEHLTLTHRSDLSSSSLQTSATSHHHWLYRHQCHHHYFINVIFIITSSDRSSLSHSVLGWVHRQSLFPISTQLRFTRIVIFIFSDLHIWEKDKINNGWVIGCCPPNFLVGCAKK